MKLDSYNYLKSEEAEVTRIISRIPEERWIEKASFEGRLESIQEELAGMEPTKPKRTATLTFRGDPVRGSEAISADFASKVTGFFNDAVTAIAASLNDRLGYMGRIPGKRDNQLYISGTAIGSFGFEFEIPDAREESDNAEATTQDALNRLMKIFRTGEKGDDEELAQIVDEVHPRAAAKVSELLEFMVSEKAYCALRAGEEEFRFQSLQNLKKTAANIKSDRIRKGEKEFEGVFSGSLPDSREFEFKPSDGLHSWKGRIGAEIDDAEKLYPYLRRPVKVSLAYTQVGDARPRYTLESLTKIQSLSDE
jgi:hypothetical protein